MKDLTDDDARIVAKALKFLNTLSTPDLVPFVESLGLPGQRVPEVARRLDRIRSTLEDE